MHPTRTFLLALQVEQAHPGTLTRIILRYFAPGTPGLDRALNANKIQQAAYLIGLLGCATLRRELEEYK